MKQDLICAGPLTEDALTQAMDTFLRQIRPHRETLLDYYRNEQSVRKGAVVRGRPNNLLRVPFPHYISEVQTGYFLGMPPTLSFSDPAQSQLFYRTAGGLGWDTLLTDVARDLSIFGAGFVLVWLEQSGLKMCRCDPRDCFTLRSGRAGAPLVATVRLYQDEEGETRGVLYQQDRQQPFVWDGRQAHLGQPEENLLGTLALVPFINNPEGTGDFERVTDLVDAYDLLLSGAMDDMQSVANAFLALYGMQGTTEKDIEQANRTRILSLTEGGRAEFVVKQLNHEALSKLETNLRHSILQLSMTPDLSDEAFLGNSSGVALQYKLWGIEQVRAVKERSFREGLRPLLDAMAGGLTLLGTPASFREVQIDFFKNMPQNHAEQAETLLSLSPILSRQTILENLPWVKDAEEELHRKQQEETP